MRYKSFFKYLIIENIMEIATKSSELKAETEMRSLRVEIFSNLSILLSIEERV